MGWVPFSPCIFTTLLYKEKVDFWSKKPCSSFKKIIILGGQYWGMNSGRHTCYAGALPLEPNPMYVSLRRLKLRRVERRFMIRDMIMDHSNFLQVMC
jgi:hypothetical protein